MIQRLLILTAMMLVLGKTSVFSQDREWQHSSVKDPTTGNEIDRLSLDGEYLEVPPTNTKLDVPRLVLLCADGKLIRQYGLERTLLWNGGVRIEAVIDGKRKSASADVMATRDRFLTDDEARRTFSTFDLRNILLDVLRGKTIRMSVRDDYGSSYRGAASVAVLVEFRMPDPKELMTSCGLKL